MCSLSQASQYALAPEQLLAEPWAQTDPWRILFPDLVLSNPDGRSLKVMNEEGHFDQAGFKRANELLRGVVALLATRFEQDVEQLRACPGDQVEIEANIVISSLYHHFRSTAPGTVDMMTNSLKQFARQRADSQVQTAQA
jgi:hypothetical protein